MKREQIKINKKVILKYSTTEWNEWVSLTSCPTNSTPLIAHIDPILNNIWIIEK